MIYTTLNHIRKHSPCADGWGELLAHLGKTRADDDPLAYSTILESNGLDDALWCLRAEPQHSKIWRMFAVRCARRVQHLLIDPRSIQAPEVAERHARGEATDEELASAWEAAKAASALAAGTARAAVWEAAKAAAGAAATDAWTAAWANAGAASGDEQTADFQALLAAHHAMPGESCELVDWWDPAHELMTAYANKTSLRDRRKN